MNQKKPSASDRKFNNSRYDKTKTYVINEKTKNDENVKSEKDFHKEENSEQKNYYINEKKLKYWNSDNENKKNQIDVFFILSLNISESIKLFCHYCKNIFDFNNQLHDHLKLVHRIKRKNRLLKFFADVVKILKKSSTARKSSAVSISILNIFSKLFANVDTLIYFITRSTTAKSDVTSFNDEKIFINNKENLSIIIFNIDVFKKIDIDYEFRKYNYVKEKVALSEKIEENSTYFNIDADVICNDRIFFH